MKVKNFFFILLNCIYNIYTNEKSLIKDQNLLLTKDSSQLLKHKSNLSDTFFPLNPMDISDESMIPQNLSSYTKENINDYMKNIFLSNSTAFIIMIISQITIHLVPIAYLFIEKNIYEQEKNLFIYSISILGMFLVEQISEKFIDYFNELYVNVLHNKISLDLLKQISYHDGQKSSIAQKISCTLPTQITRYMSNIILFYIKSIFILLRYILFVFLKKEINHYNNIGWIIIYSCSLIILNQWYLKLTKNNDGIIQKIQNISDRLDNLKKEVVHNGIINHIFSNKHNVFLWLNDLEKEYKSLNMNMFYIFLPVYCAFTLITGIIGFMLFNSNPILLLQFLSQSFNFIILFFKKQSTTRDYNSMIRIFNELKPLMKKNQYGTDTNIKAIDYSSLQIINGSKTINGKEILSNINLKFFDLLTENKQQHIIILWGNSGSGKTTLGKILLNLLTMDQSSIMVKIKDYQNQIKYKKINEIHPSIWSQVISLIPQDSYLYSMDLQNNLTLGNNTITQQAIDEVCQILKLSDLLKEKDCNNFSFGQKKRLSYGRFLLNPTPIVILDEPEAGLDQKNIDIIMKNIKNNKKIKIIIMITHNLDLAAQGDKIIDFNQNTIKIYHNKIDWFNEKKLL